MYKMLIGEHYEAHQLVFVDESHFNRIMLRRSHAWAPHGDRAHRREFLYGEQSKILFHYSIHVG
jgi:hypothetical protein